MKQMCDASMVITGEFGVDLAGWIVRREKFCLFNELCCYCVKSSLTTIRLACVESITQEWRMENIVKALPSLGVTCSH